MLDRVSFDNMVKETDRLTDEIAQLQDQLSNLEFEIDKAACEMLKNGQAFVVGITVYARDDEGNYLKFAAI